MLAPTDRKLPMIVVPMKKLLAGKVVAIVIDSCLTQLMLIAIPTHLFLPKFIALSKDAHKTMTLRTMRFQCRIVSWRKNSPHAVGQVVAAFDLCGGRSDRSVMCCFS